MFAQKQPITQNFIYCYFITLVKGGGAYFRTRAKIRKSWQLMPFWFDV
jgi:hypothetical protein